jgi:hypothetical protein
MFVLLVLHIAEELSSFPAWATRHFGTTTTSFYIVSHIPLVAAVLYLVRRASAPSTTTIWIWLIVSVQWALVMNGLFHAITTLLFQEYAPGVATGVGLYFPFTAYLLRRVLAEHYLTGGQIIASCMVGTVVSALFVASLWLHADFI